MTFHAPAASSLNIFAHENRTRVKGRGMTCRPGEDLAPLERQKPQSHQLYSMGCHDVRQACLGLRVTAAAIARFCDELGQSLGTPSTIVTARVAGLSRDLHDERMPVTNDVRMPLSPVLIVHVEECGSTTEYRRSL